MPGIEASRIIRSQFIDRCARIYRVIEQAIVPRLLADKAFMRARNKLWNPSWVEDLRKVKLAFSRESLEVMLDEISSLEIDIEPLKNNPANCAEIDELFTLSSYGVKV